MYQIWGQSERVIANVFTQSTWRFEWKVPNGDSPLESASEEELLSNSKSFETILNKSERE